MKRTVTLIKGTNLSWPFIFKLWFTRKSKYLDFEITFTESCKYILPPDNDSDQEDWNKGPGISHGIDARKRSVILGWRWTPSINKFELCGYFHDSSYPGGRYWSEVLHRTDANVPVKGRLMVERNSKQYVVAIEGQQASKEYTHNKRWARLSQCVFGGDRKTPHWMKLFLNLKFS